MSTTIQDPAKPGTETTQVQPKPQEVPKEAPKELPHSALRKALGILKPVADPKAEAVARKEQEQEQKKPENAAKPTEEKKPDPAPKSDKAPDPEPEAPARVKKVQKPAPVVKVEGADELRAAAKGITEAAKEIRRAAKEPEQKVEPLELPDDIDPEELQALEKIDPVKFKDFEKRGRAFWGKGGIEDKYIAEWKRAHPGQEFDKDAEEHADFYETNEPYASTADRAKAQRRIGADLAKAEAEATAKRVSEPVQRQLARDRADRDSKAPMDQFLSGLRAAAVEAADPEMKGADLSKLKEEHPMLDEIVGGIHQSVQPAISELFALKHGAPFDSKNKTHEAIMGVAVQLERQILDLPEDDRALPVLGKGGKVVAYRQFVPMAQYRDMDEDQRRGAWTVTEDTVLEAIQNDVKSETARLFKAESEKIARYGGAVKRKTPAKQVDDDSGEDGKPSDKNETQQRSVEVGATNPTPTPKSDEGGDSKKKHPHLMKMLGIG